MASRLPSLLSPQLGFAHRGARAHAPENTLEAFRLALRLGATGLESDAWLTADGQVVLDHDGFVGRWPRRRPIRNIPRSDLPAHIPTLDELYQDCGLAFALSLDIKDPSAVPAIVAVARSAGAEAESRLWMCHDDVESLASWRGIAPDAKLVHSSALRRLERGPEIHAAHLQELSIDALNLHHADWTGGRIALVHRFDRLAFAWGCQYDHVLADMLDSGIDAVYSDHVDLMADALTAL